MTLVKIRLPVFIAACLLVIPPVLRSQAYEYKWAEIDEEAFEKTQPTKKIMDVIGIKAGMYVGEVGAGGGRVAVRGRFCRRTISIYFESKTESDMPAWRMFEIPVFSPLHLGPPAGR